MTTQVVTDWKKEWFEIEDATYLNTAAHTVMPRVSISAVEHALEAKKFPHRVDDSVWFDAPVRIRKSLSKMIGAKPEEIAVTTGASAGAAVVAYGLEWKRGDEIITVQARVPAAVCHLEAHGRTGGREAAESLRRATGLSLRMTSSMR